MGWSVAGYTYGEAGASFRTARFFQAFQVEFPETTFAWFIFGTGDFYKTFV